jgi:hypothetical protein
MLGGEYLIIGVLKPVIWVFLHVDSKLQFNQHMANTVHKTHIRAYPISRIASALETVTYLIVCTISEVLQKNIGGLSSCCSLTDFVTYLKNCLKLEGGSVILSLCTICHTRLFLCLPR